MSKRRDAPYRSGECRDWRKVKRLRGGRPIESDGVYSSALSRGWHL
jgi:ATP-dependent DNA ligase